MHNPCYPLRSNALILAGSLALLFAVPAARAANSAWSATPGSANWSDAANWGGTLPATSGTLTFGNSSVTELNNDLTDASFVVNSIVFNAPAPAYVISGNAFTLNGSLSNFTTVAQTIHNNITLGNAGQYFALKADGGDIILGGTVTNAGSGTNLTTSGTGTLVIKGTVDLGTAQFNPGASTTLKVDGGSLKGIWGNGSVGGVPASGTVQVTNSGTFAATSIYENTHFLLQDSGLATLGSNSSSPIRKLFVTTTGGTTAILGVTWGGLNLNAGGSAVVSYGGKASLISDTDANGDLTIGGNASVTMAGGLDLAGNGAAVTGTGTVNLNGGTLTVASLIKSNATTGSTIFNFNGGTLKFTTAASVYTSIANHSFNVLEGGAVIDTQENAVTFNKAILSGTANDGGLRKLGLGNLIFGGVNTYTGETTVSSGTLTLSIFGTIANTSAINVAGGAVFDLTAKSGYNILSGQTVKGGGTLAIGAGKTITVNSGAHWAPGASIGQNSVTGNLTLSAGSATDIELGTASANKSAANMATANDRTNVSGVLTLGGTLNLIDNGGAHGQGSAGAGSYLIFTGAGVSGSFGSIGDVGGFHAAVDSASVAGNVYVDLNYYAQTGFTAADGGEIASSDATHFTLTLAGAAPGSGIQTATISLDNVLQDAVYQDLLGGGFDLSLAGDFDLTGFLTNMGTLAGGSSATLTVSFDTTGAEAGWHYGTVVFHPTSTNGAGTVTQGDVTLTLQFEAVPEPATWTMLMGGLGMMAFIQRARRKL